MSIPSFSGVVPSLAQVADLGPPRSEIGVGCLMPWAGKLYVLNYTSHRRATGSGTSLRVIEPDLTMTRHPAGVDGTFANRMVHDPSNQMIIGPHVVDARHNVRTCEELVRRDVRLCGTAPHLTAPDRLVYMMGMEGELFELDVHTLACTQIADLNQALGTEGTEGRVHFKDCYSAFGKLVVCSNEYDELDWNGTRAQGRLAEWDGKTWTLLERKPFVAIYGRQSFGGTMFAIGWDRASALLKAYTHADRTWRTYRLPKASHCFDHKWQTEWPRIREVEHERFLMDHHGMFYELSPWAYGSRVWGVRPVSTHLWVHGDFCSWRGLLVLGADNASPSHGKSITTAEPQSGLWFGKTDDLWQLGKPAGWGGPWWDTPVTAGTPSDPYLMTGFEHKCVHVTADRSCTVAVEVDFRGDGRFARYASLAVDGYAHHVFPTGFSAHWVRLVADADCTATAQFVYT